MSELISVVHVPDSDGTYHVFSPGDEVPPWAQKAITNPAVWDEPPVVKKVPAKKVTAAKAPAKAAGTPDTSSEAAESGDYTDDGDDADNPPPPAGL